MARSFSQKNTVDGAHIGNTARTSFDKVSVKRRRSYSKGNERLLNLLPHFFQGSAFPAL